VFLIIGPLFSSVFLVIYSNTMVLYIVSIVIAMVGAGDYWLIQYETLRSAAAGRSFG
jgi:hypothetical protein